MSETKITISLDLVDKAAQKALNDFIGKSDSADKSLKKLGDSGRNTFNDIGVHIGKSMGIYDIFVGNLAANLVTKAFDSIVSSASSLFNLFITEGIAASKAQEEAQNELNIALAQTGIYSAKTADEFDAFATTLQNTTGIQDEVILKNAALIQNLAQLDKDGLKRATKAAIDLSAALGKDLGTASEALGKAANGNITALTKMGIQIEKGQTKAQTFNNTLKALEDRFGGTAAAKINTYGGAVQFATNQFGDLQEEVGGVITQNVVVVDLWKNVGKLIISATQHVKEHGQSYRELVANGIIVALQGLQGLAAGMDAIVKVFRGSVEVIAYPFKVLASSIEAARLAAEGKFSQAWDVLKNGAKDAALEVGDAFNKDTVFLDIGEQIATLQGSAEQSFVAMANGATAAVEPVNQVKTATDDLTEAQKKYNAELLTWVTNLAKAGTDSKSVLEEQLEILKAQNEARLISDVEYVEQKNEAQVLQLDEEQKRLDEFNVKSVEDQKLKNDAQTALDSKYRVQKIKSDTELKKAEEALNKQKVEAVASTFGNLSSLMQTSNKELFEIGKAAAIAQATINTYLAITTTMASVPFPFNVPLAVAQGIAGFVQVSNIAKQQPGFEDGGIVPGNSFTGDKVGANVNSGEMILNRSQQTELFRVANGNNGASGLAEEMRNVRNLLSAVLSMPISVNVDGKELFRVIRDGQASGRSFA